MVNHFRTAVEWYNKISHIGGALHMTGLTLCCRSSTHSQSNSAAVQKRELHHFGCLRAFHCVTETAAHYSAFQEELLVLDGS